MGAVFFFEKELPDYSGGAEKFTLSVAERDGLVAVGLSNADHRACVLELDEARELITALENAVTRVGHKG